jgi:Flp pilus assembly protein TadG
MRRFHREGQGQSLIEFALALPVLLLIVFGVTDFARAFYYSIEISGAARAGAREAIITEITDIGDAIRSEPNSAIANTSAVWGDTGPGGANGDCTSAAGSQHCGDPNGCPASAFTGTRLACFAIRTCTLSGGDQGTCTSYGAWGSRPVSTSSTIRAVQVTVIYRFNIVTPVIGQIMPTTNGFLRLSQIALGNELYF